MLQLLKKKLALCITVKRKVDFAAITKEKMAIFIASGKKLNLQQLLRKKIVMCVAVRIKMDFAAVPMEKAVYS